MVVLRPCAVRLPLPQTYPYAGAYFCNELAPMRSSLSYNKVTLTLGCNPIGTYSLNT